MNFLADDSVLAIGHWGCEKVAASVRGKRWSQDVRVWHARHYPSQLLVDGLQYAAGTIGLHEAKACVDAAIDIMTGAERR
jgi:hypothetical protein